jgi:hypothetical protein
MSTNTPTRCAFGGFVGNLFPRYYLLVAAIRADDFACGLDVLQRLLEAFRASRCSCRLPFRQDICHATARVMRSINSFLDGQTPADPPQALYTHLTS